MKLKDITFSYRVADVQKNLFTPHHTRFLVAMSVNGCDPFITDYQCNTKYELPNVESVLECVMTDAMAFDNSCDILDFAFQYGYKDADKARDAYTACEKASRWFETEWSDKDFTDIYEKIFES